MVYLAAADCYAPATVLHTKTFDSHRKKHRPINKHWPQEDARPLLLEEVWRQGDLEKAKDRRRSLQGDPMCYKLFQYPKHFDQKISPSISGMFLLGF